MRQRSAATSWLPWRVRRRAGRGHRDGPLRAAGARAAAAPPPALVFDDHNAEYAAAAAGRRATDPRRPRALAAALYSLVQWRRLARYERRVCRAADASVAVSDADARGSGAPVPGVERRQWCPTAWTRALPPGLAGHPAAAASRRWSSPARWTSAPTSTPCSGSTSRSGHWCAAARRTPLYVVGKEPAPARWPPLGARPAA